MQVETVKQVCVYQSSTAHRPVVNRHGFPDYLCAACRLTRCTRQFRILYGDDQARPQPEIEARECNGASLDPMKLQMRKQAMPNLSWTVANRSKMVQHQKWIAVGQLGRTKRPSHNKAPTFNEFLPGVNLHCGQGTFRRPSSLSMDLCCGIPSQPFW